MSEPTHSSNGTAQADDAAAGDRREARSLRLRRRRRIRRRGKRAYIRSVQFLPTLATLGNGVCGFAAIYVATLAAAGQQDPVADYLVKNRFLAAVYLIALAMIFDALDGRLARFARHTTDFGGQLDSLADAISFGAAPAIIALHVFKFDAVIDGGFDVPLVVGRLVWACGGLYVACALLRLARFNVSNEHGEQAHMSFLGLPSPAAAGVVLGVVLMQQDLLIEAAARPETTFGQFMSGLAAVLTVFLPLVVLTAGLLMVSNFRYPHVVNRLIRGRRGIGSVVLAIALVLLLVVQHRYVLGVVGLIVAYSGPTMWLVNRARHRAQTAGGG